MLEGIIEIIIEVVGEFILQMLAELLLEFGLHGMAAVFTNRKERNPVLAALGYLLLGVVIGGLSLLVFKHSLIASGVYRYANLILTPVIAGFLMALVGAFRRLKGRETLRIDSFFYGFLFALGMSGVRFLFTS